MMTTQRETARAADWLCLAATPAFAIMALITGVPEGPPDMLCSSMQHASPLSGMTVMYLLMSVVHAAPWLRLVSSRFRARRFEMGPDQC